MQLAEMTAVELKQRLAAGQTSCVDILRSVFAAIDQRESTVKAFLHLRDRSTLLAEADAVDQRRSRGERVGALAGLPVAIKDNICTKGTPTTCASRMLEKFVPPYDATVVRRVKEADGILLGKTNLDEFAMGSSTENSALQLTRNPHQNDCVPGGTSGGSAAALAAHETILALGSDTGGSIRQPASFCGVVGLKPTYGRVSRYGLVAHGSSLDQIGPMARCVADAALLLSVIAGHDPMDSTSLTSAVPDLSATSRPMKIGVPQEYFGDGLDGEVRDHVRKAISLLEKDGHPVVPISLPTTPYAIPTYYVIACAEASSNLARYDGVKYGFRAPEFKNLEEMLVRSRTQGFGVEVKRRIMLGTYVLSSGYHDAYYNKAAKVRTLIARELREVYKTCDVIIHPVAPTVAFKIGDHTKDPLSMYLGDVYSVVANLAGLPAISIPCGRHSSGLPIGVQLMAPWLGEAALVGIAARLEMLLQDQ